MPDHAELAQVERHEDPDDVELDQPGRLGVEGPDQDHRHQREEHDAVAVGEPVPARAERPRQQAVLGEDRAEDGETVERGVGRQHKDDAGHAHDEVEPRGEVLEHTFGDLGDHRVLLVAAGQSLASGGTEPLEVQGIHQPDAHLVGEHDDAHHHRDRDQSEQQQRGGGVTALRAAEGRNAVRDRLDTGQGRAARGEGARQEEHQRDLAEWSVPALGRLDLQACALGVGQVTGEQLQQPEEAHAEDGDHEQVGGDGEERAGLAYAAQVERGQHGDGDHRDRRLMTDQARDRTGGILCGR